MREVSAGIAQPQQGQGTDQASDGGVRPQGQMGGGPQSSTLKLPQNTNQGF